MKDKIQRLLDVSDWLVAFVRAAILDEPLSASIPEDFDWNALYILSVRQKLSAITWRGICVSNCTIPTDVREKWDLQAQHVLSKEIRFDYEFDRIIQEFNDVGIQYVPLKGRLIRNFWPGKGLREFSDIDILIRQEDLCRAGEIMQKLGYEADHIGGMHDVYKKPPIYNVELHVRLFASFIEFGHFFDQVWDRVVPANPDTFAYKMTPADFYLHFLLHFIKHSEHSGAGLRFFVDLFLIQRSHFLTDEAVDQVHDIIKELNLWDVLTKLYQITEKLFVERTAISDDFREYIFSGSAYGCSSWRIHNGLKEQGKFKYVVRRIFPPYAYVRNRYKVVQYVPILLPFAWVYRWIHHLFSRKHRSNIVSEIRGVRKYE